MKRFLSTLVCIAIIVSTIALPGAGISSQAATHYNLNTYSIFSNRSKEEVASRYAQAVATETSMSNRYTTQPSLEAPYNAGVASNATHVSIFSMLNYCRWLVGVNSLSTSYGSSTLQAEALLRNFQFDHQISRSNMPSDLPDSIWNAGSGVNHNILSIGYSPVMSILNFINEGYSTRDHTFNTVGHRFFLLSYKTSGMNFGYSGTVEIGSRTSATGTMNLPFTSFPPAGYVPDSVIYRPYYTSWTIELNSSMLTFSKLSDIKITVTDLDNNSSYICTSANGKLAYDNYYTMLSFAQPEVSGSSYGNHRYRVQITGLKDKSGGAVTGEYTVEFFDESAYVDSPIESIVLGNGCSSVVVSSLASSDLSYVCSVLGDTLLATCENGREVELTVNDEWRVNTTEHYFYNSSCIDFLPEHVTDGNHVMSNIRIPYEIDYSGYVYQSNTTKEPGSSFNLQYQTYYVNNVNVSLYQVDSSGNTILRGESIDGSLSVDGNTYSYAMNNLRTSDSGTYVFTHVSTSYLPMYISKPVTLNVTVTPSTTPIPTGSTSGGNSGSNSGSGGSASVTVVVTTTTPVPGGSSNSGSTSSSNPSSSAGVGDFVERLYTIALNRPSDPNGKADWVNRVYTQGYTGADLARGFLYSPEFLNMNMNDVEFLDILYRTFFDRAGDPAGLSDWLNRMDAGWTKLDVIQGFIDSVEWANLCLSYGIQSGGAAVPNVTVIPNDGIISFATRLYTTCLCRNADPTGLIDWSTRLANRQISGSEAARGFFFSAEFMNDSSIDNAEYINRLYLTFMGRPADTAGFNDWMNRMYNGASREDVFNGFAGSQEWAGICSSYGILK